MLGGYTTTAAVFLSARRVSCELFSAPQTWLAGWLVTNHDRTTVLQPKSKRCDVAKPDTLHDFCAGISRCGQVDRSTISQDLSLLVAGYVYEHGWVVSQLSVSHGSCREMRRDKQRQKTSITIIPSPLDHVHVIPSSSHTTLKVDHDQSTPSLSHSPARLPVLSSVRYLHPPGLYVLGCRRRDTHAGCANGRVGGLPVARG
ncbi:hypothetical protein IWZ01DRAFT_105075 [Phyllosticta capitalensis]